MTTEILDNNNTGEMTVLKVYELAADAGRECQQLIEQFGQDSASNVTLKIISILEHLELLVNEKTELEKKVSKLNENLVTCQNELSRKTEENAHLLIVSIYYWQIYDWDLHVGTTSLFFVL